MTFEIIDADGHVTEPWEQIARHLEEPYRRRSLLTPSFPQDGWDRRLMGSKGAWAADGKSWAAPLDGAASPRAHRCPRGGDGHERRGARAISEIHPGAHGVARLRPASADHLHDVRRHPRAFSRAQHRLSRGGIGLDPVFPPAHGRGIR